MNGGIIKTIHRARGDHGLAERRRVDQHDSRGGKLAEPIIGRVVGKSLAGAGMGARIYLVAPGVDGRFHHLEFAGASRLENVSQGMITGADPSPPDRGHRITISPSLRRAVAVPIWQAATWRKSATGSRERGRTRRRL